MDPLVGWLQTSLLVALRIAPVLAFAPPFTLVRAPGVARALIALGLGAALASSGAVQAASPLSTGGLLAAGMTELAAGGLIVLAFQLTFAAIYFAGRTVDVQSGMALATLVDPSSQARTPLVGTLFALLAGAAFFATDGHFDLLKVFAVTFDLVPPGSVFTVPSPARIGAFTAVAFMTAMGVAGGAILALFLADVGIALLSRTVPQMNALVLGFQAKTMLLLVVLPLTLGVSASLLLRLNAMALSVIPELFA
ncbi:flagellar biosynthetic protein FliR [Brevundimonas faecalis]|uniref:flagellar biosynthetic protein FliR n=1 Tax=Brevundimonas faecalis TaxID=947378 RepID=UPI003618974A